MSIGTLTISLAAVSEGVPESSNSSSAQNQDPQAPPPPSCPQPPTLTKPPVKTLPTPNHPPRRSIFSFVPQNKPPTQPQQSYKKRAVQDTLPRGLPPMDPPAPTREDVTAKVPHRTVQHVFPHSHPLPNLSSENGVVRQPASGLLADEGQRLPDSMWDVSIIQTRLEGAGPGRRRDQDKCNQQ